MTEERSSTTVLAIDQGTTGTKALLLDGNLNVLAEAGEEFPQHFPKPGWVEHEPEEIFASVRTAVRAAIEAAGVAPESIAAIGITNQRETSIVWDAESGEAIHRAIVWQDRRTADLCQTLKLEGLESLFRERTGLLLDPYFSGTKVRWLLDNVANARKQAEAGQLRFGTVDTYVTWRLTGGASHVTDPSNASRTLLYDLAKGGWDPELLELLQVPDSLLPEVRDNDSTFGTTKGLDFLPDGIPIAALLGDQQAALFGQACFDEGEVKCTYGTGAFLILNTGFSIVRSKRGLLSTAAWRIGGKTTYALEGSCFVAGAIVQWLRDGLGFIERSEDVESLARSVPDSGGVVLVPSLTGLGAPHWDPNARGVISGLTRGTTSGHIARAALEGVALQIQDVLDAMQRDLGRSLPELKVDGGASANDLLMQFQADILGVDTVRPRVISTTSLGAALQAGLTVGLFSSLAEIRKTWTESARWRPKMKKKDVGEILRRWEIGVRQARLTGS